jgi:hypothetical protein
MKFTFPIKQDPVKDWMIKDIAKIQKSNGLFRLLEAGYSWHQPIFISPDDVANNICCIWSKYVFLNAEKFRDEFVKHSGKKELVYRAGGTYSQERMPEFMDGLARLMSADTVLTDGFDWMDYSSSITMPTDKFIRSVAKLASQKAYYQYEAELMCGFPSVELGGTEEDWQAVLDLIMSMPPIDKFLMAWQLRLYSTVDQMISGKEDFWQRCLTSERYGSGGQQNRSGWILEFNPIDESGQPLKVVKNKDILDLTVDFDLKVNDNGNEFMAHIAAGPTQVAIGDHMTVQNFFHIKESNV